MRRWLQVELVPGSARDLEEAAGAALLALLPLGCLGVEERPDRLLAFFPEGADREPIVEALARSGAGLEATAWTGVEDPGWVEAFHRSLRPIDVGRRFTILPGREGEAGPGRLALRFEPGRAFGTGHHASTRLALTWLEDTVTAGDRVLDVGTGTGILAAAAARLGARRVLATDNDPEAVEVAEATLEALPERERVELAVADGVGGDEGVHDVVVANITADVLVPMLPDLVERTAPEGRLVLAGLLGSDRARVGARLEDLGFATEWREEGEWVSCRARRS